MLCSRRFFPVLLGVGVPLVCTHVLPADVVIETVTIGDPGNDADESSGYGAVDYVYEMGKYEVTDAQYCEFLNAVDPNGSNPHAIYSSCMSDDIGGFGGINCDLRGATGSKYSVIAGRGSMPVNWVSWFDSLRFANWMHNGQGDVDTETGAYTITGSCLTTVREPDARYVLPTFDEWYKAAYYDPDKGGSAGYWDYPTMQDEPNPPSPGLEANFGNAVRDFTDVGTYSSYPSAFGTFDQGGNIFEWTSTVVYQAGGWECLEPGGSFDLGLSELYAARGPGDPPEHEKHYFGFRLAVVPEPTTVYLLVIGATLLSRRRGG